MKIDTAGTYTLRYTATDECGNVGTVDRTVNVIAIAYRTVLYNDGTFIINEISTDQAANEALHGTAVLVFEPLSPSNPYVFTSASQVPWRSRPGILSAKVGSVIQPQSTAFWFTGLSNCTDIDLTNIDTSQTTTTESMFQSCSSLTHLNLANMVTSNVTTVNGMFTGCHSLEHIDLSSFDTSRVEGMAHMFSNCTNLASLDLSNFNTSEVTNMYGMFNGCSSLTTLDLSSFDTRKVTRLTDFVRSCSALEVLDISSFNTSAVSSVAQMFDSCSSLKTIYASVDFNISRLTRPAYYSNLFANMSTNLVGGAGTVWSSAQASAKAYARIDGGTANPGYFTAKA